MTLIAMMLVVIADDGAPAWMVALAMLCDTSMILAAIFMGLMA